MAAVTPQSLPRAQELHSLSHADQDSLAAKARADSIQAHADSLKADSLGSRADTVNYSAKRIRYRNDRFSLSDKALLTYRGSSLAADSIVFYSQDNVVEAMGGPLISDPANPSISGYKMRYNLKTKVGEIYYGSSKKGNQTFNGVEVRRQKDGEILIARGDFSTCDIPQDKHYFFYSRRMILEPKSKVLSGPIVMNVGDVPVAILPMMVMPLGSGRRSGLLQPKVGGDQTQGFFLRGLGYYWAINDYTDWMASGDVIEGTQGTFNETNVNSEFRYNKRYAYNGLIGGTYYISEFDVTRPDWSMKYSHDQTITPDGKQKLSGSGTFVSKSNVLDRNAFSTEEKEQQTANANFGYRRQFDWNQSTLNAEFSQFNNLTTELLERSIPNVTYSVSAPLFPKPDDETVLAIGEDDPWYRKIQYRYNPAFNIFMTEHPAVGTTLGDTTTYAGFKDGLRLDAKYPVLQYFNVTPSVDFSQMWTATQRGDVSDPIRSAWDPANGETGEYFASWQTGVSMDTRIYGIAQPEKPWFGKVSGVRHTITPSVGYTYAPEIDTNPRFLPNPKLAASAFQLEQQTIGLNLSNDVDIKLAPPPSAAGAAAAPASPGAAQGIGPKAPKAESYKLISANSNISYNMAKDTREWSDIPSSFSVYLTRTIPFTLTTNHTLYDNFAADGRKDHLVSPILTMYSFGWRKGIQVAGNFNSGVRIKDTRGFPTDRFDATPWSMDMNYSFAFTSNRVGGDAASPAERAFGINGTFQRNRTHTANGGLKLNPTAGWQMSYDTDYNFSEGEFSRHSFNFHRTLHCWVMDFRWTPQGISEGWNFSIRITELPDVKLETSDTRARRLR